MRILLLGKDGQVGWELQRSLAPLGLVRMLGRDEADLAQPESLRAWVRGFAPSVIVNAAAHTAVDKAESEPDLAYAVNAWAPAAMARACQARRLPLLHVSTDMVFSGDKTAPYVETDAPAPLHVYGASKLAGEQAVLAACDRALVMRVSWLFSA